MFLEPYLLSGPLRIIFLFALTLFINRLISTKISALTALNFLIPVITLVLSSVLVGSFILVLTYTFDLFVVISIAITLIILTFMKLDFTRPIKDQVQRIYSRTILYVTIKLEKRKSFLDKDNFIKPTYKNKDQGLSRYHKNWQLAIGFSLPVITYISRNSLFNQDIYTLSSSWFKDLDIINGISNNQWFFQAGEMMGDYLLINLYSKITNITYAEALQTFGVLESALLSLIIYWVVFKISKKHSSGIISGLSFALLYSFLPFNIELLAEHKSVFTALVIALPTMFFCIYPQSFRFTNKFNFSWIIVLFSAVLMIDLFVGVLLVFPFLLLVLFFKFRHNLKQSLQTLFAYLVSVVLIGSIYGIAALIKGEDFIAFIVSNLYSFDAYTYNPNLVIPFSELMYYYQITGVFFLLITVFNFIRKPLKWISTIVFLTFINLLFGVYQLNEAVVDRDILSQVLCIFLPIFFGIVLHIIIDSLSFFNLAPRRAIALEVSMGALVITALVFLTFTPATKLNYENDKTKNLIFEVYSKIQSRNLPYSYAVVNSSQYSSFSKNSHYYYGYDYFNNNYISRDRLFNRHKDDAQYLSNNPNVILPQALFVFIYTNSEKTNSMKKQLFKNQQDLTLQRINLLISKGRDVVLYYQNKDLDVYQIVNKKGSSNINELLFQ
ncbi:hypothetical protein [Gillisia limnaea]|uniref:Uncharacterized protein n=1 Tax=Gillisia limnaea (strain DSM 15749 / LMG 21470 / R-8282) TaxID=865937 RepID=H2BR54_GILLR|nr:hypothetical protein [Gillisia limnaea]EHQ04373.1 hypothetical protein Gilli_0223 [Gillisia limnaea DSM 15749]